MEPAGTPTLAYATPKAKLRFRHRLPYIISGIVIGFLTGDLCAMLLRAVVDWLFFSRGKMGHDAQYNELFAAVVTGGSSILIFTVLGGVFGGHLARPPRREAIAG